MARSPHLPQRDSHSPQRACSRARRWTHHLPTSLPPHLPTSLPPYLLEIE